MLSCLKDCHPLYTLFFLVNKMEIDKMAICVITELCFSSFISLFLKMNHFRLEITIKIRIVNADIH